MLHLHRAERSDTLAGALAELLLEPLNDPFAPDIVSVPTKGVERWLAQRLARSLGSSGGGDGVCANVAFPQPSRLIAGILAESAASAGEWEPGRVTWNVLDVLEECAAEPWGGPLARHLGGGNGPSAAGARLVVAQKVARLFASYGDNRPQMLRDWADGNDSDGAGEMVPADLGWQPPLWRRVRAMVASQSPAEILPAACRALESDPGILDLPQRLSLFGPTRLSTTELDVLSALAQHRDVHLWLPHPSNVLWNRVKDFAVADRPRRRTDPSVAAARTPLLASLSADVRELQSHLGAYATKRHDEYHGSDGWPETLLGQLQRSIARDEAPSTPAALDPRDRSVQVHACHGPARQVEVLREVLVGLLADDASIEPRDVIVMCPNIEDYAALISGTFGLADGIDDAHPGHRLRVRLADRSLRQTNPLFGLLATLLDLGQARATASEILDLAAQPPVRRRFGFSDDDLELLAEWVAQSGVRWGLDAGHRRLYGLERVQQNTWRAGLDRILLGAAMAEEDHRWIDTALPFDDVDSNDIALAGRLAELVDRLVHVVGRLAGNQPVSEWVAAFTEALDLLAVVSDRDGWQLSQVRRELGELVADAGQAGQRIDLSLGDVYALLADRLEGRPTRANFRTGNLTMCSMQPMRSVPHRVVCLLGLDDDRFPRHSAPDGDDILARDPLVGERRPRTEDRQILLDAVMAAGDHLVVLYTGADPRTNVMLPPAVPVGELLDAVDVIAACADDRPAREQVVLRHPLQPFDARNFEAGRLGPTRPFSFDKVALRGARRAGEPRVAAAPFLPGRLPRHDADIRNVSVDDLTWFFDNPARGFLRQRLGVTLVGDEEEPSDALPIELKGLAKWSVGERLLRARMHGVDGPVAVRAERRRGAVPPQMLGERIVDDVLAELEPLVLAAEPHLGTHARTLDALVDLDHTRLTGTVVDVRGAAILRVTYARLAPRHRLRAWLQLLSLSVAHPGQSWTAVTIGKGRYGGGTSSTLGPVAATDARTLLAELVELRAEGLCRVLPMATRTSALYAERRKSGESNAMKSAETEWSGKFPEREDPAYALVWGAEADLDALCAEPAEGGSGERTRFGEVSVRLWQPLLDHEAQVRV